MKSNWKNNIVGVMVALVALVVVSCTRQSGHTGHAEHYTCPMHPDIKSDEPGACPVCGMDLVSTSTVGQEVKITDDLAPLLKSTDEAVVSSVKTVKGVYQKLSFPLEIDGIVTYDTRSVYNIPTRTGGRLERVFLKSTLATVRKGQRIAELYSPELIAAQRELLFVLESDGDRETMVQSARNKLTLLGMSNAQVEALIKHKQIQQTFSVYSPYDGYIVSNTEAASPAVPAPTGMNAMDVAGQPVTAPTNETLVREGDYVAAGQTLFRVINPSMLRVELNLPAVQGEYVKTGDEAQLNFGEGHAGHARVDFVQPFFTRGESFVKVRLHTAKTDMLHIGHLVKATLTIGTKEMLWLPQTAVLDLGLKQIVFVKQRNVFKPVQISAGLKTAEWVQVQRGLASADEVAANAQYLMDSESFIKVQ
jgi:biotin carboxyl carrier protein